MKTNDINASNNLVSTHYISTGNVIALGVIPYDDTIPQQIEGAEILSITITPKNVSNLLFFEFTGMVATSSNFANPITAALFQDAISDALSATVVNSDHTNPIYLTHVMVAGTIASTTFKVRAGPNGGPQAYVNADEAGVRFLGGVSNTTFTVYEYSV